jgi:hypothetical protein
MYSKLKAYEVLVGLIGAYVELKGTKIIKLKDRSKLYNCIYEICKEKKDIIFNFEFSRRSGELVSPDIDLCIRNLEDSGRLNCLNPDLVDFEETETLKKEYNNVVLPLLMKHDVYALFKEKCVCLGN